MFHVRTLPSKCYQKKPYFRKIQNSLKKKKINSSMKKNPTSKCLFISHQVIPWPMVLCYQHSLHLCENGSVPLVVSYLILLSTSSMKCPRRCVFFLFFFTYFIRSDMYIINQVINTSSFLTLNHHK